MHPNDFSLWKLAPDINIYPWQSFLSRFCKCVWQLWMRTDNSHSERDPTERLFEVADLGKRICLRDNDYEVNFFLDLRNQQ